MPRLFDSFGSPVQGTSEPVVVPIEGDPSSFEKSLLDSQRLANQFSANFVTQLEALALRGKSLSDVFKSLALSLSQSVLKQAFAPLQQAFTGSLSSLLGGLLKFSNGGVLKAGTPVPFASGGVISSPISFPLSGGRTGIAGERGAEAILPLARGADGRLGVQMSGGAGGGGSVTVNIATPDVESFARSETQVAALIARAVALGQRNL